MRLVGREIYVRLPVDHSEHVEIIPKSPVAFIYAGVGRKIRGIDKEHDARNIFIAAE